MYDLCEGWWTWAQWTATIVTGAACGALGYFVISYLIVASIIYFILNLAFCSDDNSSTSQNQAQTNQTQEKQRARSKITNAIREGGGECDSYSSISRQDKTTEVYQVKCKNGLTHSIEFDSNTKAWEYKGKVR